MARETINGISVPIPGTGEPADFQGDLRRFATDLPASNGPIAQVVREDRNSVGRARRRLAYWFAALGNRENACANVWVAGDSNGEAAGAVYRWLDLIAAGLVSRYPTSGVTGYGRYIPVRYENSGKPSPWAFKRGAGTVVAQADLAYDTTGRYGFGGRSLTLPKTHAPSTETMWMELSVAGATAGYVQVMGPTGQGGGGVQLYRGDGFTDLATTWTPGATDGEATSAAVVPTASPQTIRVIAQSSGTAAKVNGLFVRPIVANKGINVIDASHAGWSADTYADKQVTERTTLDFLANVGSALVPDLVILPLTINAYLLNEPVVSMVAGLTAIMDEIRTATAVGGKVSFLIVTHVSDGGHSGSVAPWQEYVDAAIALADADTHGPGGSSAVDVLCLSDFMWDPGTDNTFGLFAADKIHFLEPGHRMVADVILDRVS